MTTSLLTRSDFRRPSIKTIVVADLPPRLRRDDIREGREWLLDCFDDEDAVEVIELANAIGIYQLVQKHYEGGWAAFLAASA